MLPALTDSLEYPLVGVRHSFFSTPYFSFCFTFPAHSSSFFPSPFPIHPIPLTLLAFILFTCTTPHSSSCFPFHSSVLRPVSISIPHSSSSLSFHSIFFILFPLPLFILQPVSFPQLTLHPFPSPFPIHPVPFTLLAMHPVPFTTPHSSSCFPFNYSFFIMFLFPLLILHPVSLSIPNSSSRPPLHSSFSSNLPLSLNILHPVSPATSHTSSSLPFHPILSILPPFAFHILHPVLSLHPVSFPLHILYPVSLF
jgi:hypothetical protein